MQHLLPTSSSLPQYAIAVQHTSSAPCMGAIRYARFGCRDLQIADAAVIAMMTNALFCVVDSGAVIGRAGRSQAAPLQGDD